MPPLDREGNLSIMETVVNIEYGDVELEVHGGPLVGSGVMDDVPLGAPERLGARDAGIRMEVEMPVPALRRDEPAGGGNQRTPDAVAAKGGSDVDADELCRPGAGVAIREPLRIGRAARSSFSNASRTHDRPDVVDGHPQAVPGVAEIGAEQVVDVSVPPGKVAVAEVLVEDLKHQLPRGVQVGWRRLADAETWRLH